ncbi:glycoside hydrolase family 18 protein [Enterobacter ludwigii]
MFASWVTTPPTPNTLFIKDALGLGVKKFHLAFVAYDRASESVVWGNSYFPLNITKNIVSIINDNGAEAIFAFGGFSGLDPSVDMSVDKLTKLYVDIAKDYGVRHIDFDFETIGLYNYSKAFPAAVAAKTQIPDLHFSLTLPVTPSGLTTEGLTMINAAKSEGLDVSVQIMAMDYGQSNPDMGRAAVQAAISTKDQLAKIYPEKSESELFSLIGVTPMLGLNDTEPETFFLKDIQTLTDFAKTNGIALIGAWDLNRDFPEGTDSHGLWHGDLPTCALEPAQTEEYEFLKTFLKEPS